MFFCTSSIHPFLPGLRSVPNALPFCIYAGDGGCFFHPPLVSGHGRGCTTAESLSCCGFLPSSLFHSLHSCFVSCLNPGAKALAARPLGVAGIRANHNFVKLVWNMNDRLWQKSAGNRLFRAVYLPIDRFLFSWCLKQAPLFSLISSSVRASQTAGIIRVGGMF